MVGEIRSRRFTHVEWSGFPRGQKDAVCGVTLKSFRRFILRRRRITFVHPIVRSLLDPPSQSESVPRGVAFTAAPATSAGGSATAATASRRKRRSLGGVDGVPPVHGDGRIVMKRRRMRRRRRGRRVRRRDGRAVHPRCGDVPDSGGGGRTPPPRRPFRSPRRVLPPRRRGQPGDLREVALVRRALRRAFGAQRGQKGPVDPLRRVRADGRRIDRRVNIVPVADGSARRAPQP